MSEIEGVLFWVGYVGLTVAAGLVAANWQCRRERKKYPVCPTCGLPIDKGRRLMPLADTPSEEG